MPSPFIDHGITTQPNTLALLQLKRDLTTPVSLSSDPNAVLNTRFGNYPHSTLLNITWGSQVLASKTAGNAGDRKPRKRRRIEDDDAKANAADDGESEARLVILGTADAGFAHVLPPTPEGWTRSLPHRTQVVYTPDYSYILQRLRVRPGSVVIEAGAGSGSFTHAAARAVYDGHSDSDNEMVQTAQARPRKRGREQGRVCSYEYHAPRAEQLVSEIREHALGDTVTITHRDVYADGFLVSSPDTTDTQPQATAVFLDLPAPWLALKHLTRSTPSPLSARHTVHICTFSPCIEQVQQTIVELARLGWSSIETVTLGHHDILLRRERIGVAEEGTRDGNPTPASVDEAVAHLRASRQNEEDARRKMAEREAKGERKRGSGKVDGKRQTGKERRIEGLEERRAERKLWKEGGLVSRTEGELKGHTSFLTFAVLPQIWSDEDEARATERLEKEFGSAMPADVKGRVPKSNVPQVGSGQPQKADETMTDRVEMP